MKADSRFVISVVELYRKHASCVKMFTFKIFENFYPEKDLHSFAYFRCTVASPNLLFISYDLQCQGFKMSTWSFNFITFPWIYGTQYISMSGKKTPSVLKNFWREIQIFKNFLLMPNKFLLSLVQVYKISWRLAKRIWS